MTCPLIAIPHFGRDQRYLDLLKTWVAQLRKTLGPDARFTVFTHDAQADLAKLGFPTLSLNISAYRDVIRPGQPFDIKGALMCEAALAIREPFLMLDADALLVQNPAPWVNRFMDYTCAMPTDAGAILHGHKAMMDGEWSHVRKMCAGVFWFGDPSPAKRSELVNEYRVAWAQLLAADIPWTPRLPHLLEQYAWSVAHHRLGGATLAGCMNWPPHLCGETPLAVVNHYFGHKKWKGKGPAPKNV